MPFKDPDPTDPNMLVGVVLPADAEATRDMAYVFAEEFARMGYGRDQLLWLFKNPFYGGAHGAYQALGETEILAIIDECVNVWGRIRVTVQDVQTVQTDQTPSLILPRDGKKEKDQRFKRLEPTKRIERSAAIEPLERFEPATRGAK